MTVNVDWHVYAVTAAALFTLLALTGALRGTQAVIRMCLLTGVAVTVTGLLTGRVLAIAGGAAITAVVYWARSLLCPAR